MKILWAAVAALFLVVTAQADDYYDLYRITQPNVLITTSRADLATFVALNNAGQKSAIRDLYEKLKSYGEIIEPQPGTVVRVDEYHRDGLARVVVQGGTFVGSGSDSGYITQTDLEHAVFLGKVALPKATPEVTPDSSTTRTDKEQPHPLGVQRDVIPNKVDEAEKKQQEESDTHEPIIQYMMQQQKMTHDEAEQAFAKQPDYWTQWAQQPLPGESMQNMPSVFSLSRDLQHPTYPTQAEIITARRQLAAQQAKQQAEIQAAQQANERNQQLLKQGGITVDGVRNSIRQAIAARNGTPVRQYPMALVYLHGTGRIIANETEWEADFTTYVLALRIARDIFWRFLKEYRLSLPTLQDELHDFQRKASRGLFSSLFLAMTRHTQRQR